MGSICANLTSSPTILTQRIRSDKISTITPLTWCPSCTGSTIRHTICAYSCIVIIPWRTTCHTKARWQNMSRITSLAACRPTYLTASPPCILASSTSVRINIVLSSTLRALVSRSTTGTLWICTWSTASSAIYKISGGTCWALIGSSTRLTGWRTLGASGWSWVKIESRVTLRTICSCGTANAVFLALWACRITRIWHVETSITLTGGAVNTLTTARVALGER